MCGEGVRNILLLPLVVRCIETVYVCIWRMFACISVVVTVWVYGNVCCVVSIVKNSVLFGFGVVVKYVMCLCRGCDGCCV